MGKSLELKECFLSDLFKKKQDNKHTCLYALDSYQRPFDWGKKETQELCYDILENKVEYNIGDICLHPDNETPTRGQYKRYRYITLYD